MSVLPAADAGPGDVRPLAPLTLAEVPVMPRVQPLDATGATLRGLLANSNRYVLNTWWARHMSWPEPWDSWSARLVAKDTLDTEQVRRYSSVALALSAPLATRSYDARVTGIDVGTARARVVELVQLLVRTHRSGVGDAGWGGSWQSALWASQAGLAGWLCGPSLPEPDRVLLARMLEYEADAVGARPLHYLRDRSGKVLTPGDSGSEELAWDAVAVLTAVQLLPRHPRRSVWATDAYRRFVAAYSRPSDVRSGLVVNGVPVHRWLGGSNVEQSGIVVNRGRTSPDYTVSMSLHGAVVPALTGDGVPLAVLHGNAAMHDALTSHVFAGPRYRKPGGTVYVPRSASIYHPDGADWGTQRQVVYGVFDIQVAAFGLDRHARVPAREWAALHLGHVRRLQSRFDTGQTYGHVSEDRYFAREEWTGALLGYAELFEWLSATNRFRIDNRHPSHKRPVT